MINSLRIKNFIIVKELELNFGKGLQVLSGETGTGKSIIVGAIDFAFGGKFHPGFLFDDSKPAIVEITFDVNSENKSLLKLISEYEVDISENEICFTTELTPLQKRRIFLNGRRISRSIVKQFRDLLLDFHSQRDQQKIFDRNFQLEIIDKFGDLQTELKDYQRQFREIESLSEQLQELQTGESEREERIKLYEYQAEEIEEINPKIGEDEELQKEWNLLSNAKEIISQATFIEQAVYEADNSVYDIINSFINRLSDFEEAGSKITDIISYLKESAANLEEAVSEARNLRDSIEIDDLRLQECETRLNELNALKSKYKMELPEILNYYRKIKGLIAESKSDITRISELEAELKKKSEELHKKAEKLSEKRKRISIKLEKEIVENIKKLAIPDAEIKIKFDKVTRKKVFTSYLQGLSETGQDSVEIFFSANKGVKLQPLSVSASGGEISRVLLAIKKILSDKMESRTVIFDEIDTGIGGETANYLGEFIYKIGRFHQVVCITHLAQIASLADKNFAIEKMSKKNISEVIVRELDANEKKEEIARMLSGTKSELAVKHAEEIIKKNLRRIDG